MLCFDTIVSDLHLEIGQQYSSYRISTSAPYLLLGGDIGRLVDYNGYLTFLTALASRYTKVLLTLGNHEFYGLGYELGLDKARRLSEEPSLSGKVVLLHMRRWDDPTSNLTIFSCTLWSGIPDRACRIVESRSTTSRRYMNGLCKSIIESTQRKLPWLPTHHARCVEGASRPEHSNSPSGRLDGVKTSVFGHTHCSTQFERNGINS
ncbi:Metallo-dependent phosphatase-like protein [Hypoxylon sp. FL0890]|nr:Metallo-dependent phosphatase-like protein [Hypoxylon sp. FL0890]